MALRLTITSSHASVLGTRGTKTFGPAGGTIGRSLGNDWPLPDDQQFLSARHASIDYRSGSYYIIDTSTNGVFINESARPLGRGKPQRLFDGDKLKIGDYEIRVDIADTVDDTVWENTDPVDFAQRVEAPETPEADLIDAYEVTGIGLERFLDDDVPTLTRPVSPQELAATGVFPGDRLSAGLSARSARPLDATSRNAIVCGQAVGMLDPLFRGAGLQPQSMNAGEAEVFLLRLGEWFRTRKLDPRTLVTSVDPADQSGIRRPRVSRSP